MARHQYGGGTSKCLVWLINRSTTRLKCQGRGHDETTANSSSNIYAFKFLTNIHFACQTSLTGLFQTQLADGIMVKYLLLPMFAGKNKTLYLCY